MIHGPPVAARGSKGWEVQRIKPRVALPLRAVEVERIAAADLAAEAKSAHRAPTFYCGPAGVYANRERPPRPVGRGDSRAATDAKPGANRRARPASGLRSYEHS